MKVIVCGTRGATDVEWALADALQELWPIDLIIHGACPDSADELAEQYGHTHEIPTLPVPAKWKEHGKAAGFIRNAIMAEMENVSHCVAVWDGKSKGTLNMIQEAVRRGIPVSIIPAKL